MRDDEILELAIEAYLDDRYLDSLKHLSKIKIRDYKYYELLGLNHYRLFNWTEAIDAFNKYHKLTSSVDHFPELADCYRAQGKFAYVEKLYYELNQVKVKKDVLVEMKLVVAEVLSEQGRLEEAIELLHEFRQISRKPTYYELRAWYVLGDLLEKAGDYVGAREMFKKVVQFDPELGDVKQRLDALV